MPDVALSLFVAALNGTQARDHLLEQLVIQLRSYPEMIHCAVHVQAAQPRNEDCIVGRPSVGRTLGLKFATLLGKRQY